MPRPKPWCFPWPEPQGAYASDGPREAPLEFHYMGKRFRVSPTAEVGFNSGRMRFRVECLSCSELLHEATTGTSSRIMQHAEKACGEAPKVAPHTAKSEVDDERHENYAFKLGISTGLDNAAARLLERAAQLFHAHQDKEALLVRELAETLMASAKQAREKADAYAKANGIKE